MTTQPHNPNLWYPAPEVPGQPEVSYQPSPTPATEAMNLGVGALALAPVETHDSFSGVPVAPQVSANEAPVGAVEQAESAPRKPSKLETAFIKWQAAVSEARQEIGAMRARLETGLQDAIAEGRVVYGSEDYDKRRKAIEAAVAQGVTRSYNYNYSGNPRHNRVQHYDVTVDADGNVWGNFQDMSRYEPVTGKPVRAGKYIIHHNPLLPQKSGPSVQFAESLPFPQSLPR